MSVNVRIKQKSLFKKKLSIYDIIKITNLSCGVCDENYRLINDKIAEHTLIYDATKLARGIDVSIDGTDIILLMSLPTSPSEIRKFYEIIEKICQKLKINEYIREEELVSIKDNDKFIRYDESASITGLEDLKKKIMQDKYQRFEIFGVYNPISIGEREVNEIDISLDNFEKYLHRVQALDVYYAVPKVYKINEKLVGIYTVGPNIPSVVPTKPYIVLNQIQGIQAWYVLLKDGKTVKYEDFISNINTQEYYDQNHIVATLSDDEIDNLLNKYSVDI